MPGNDPCIGSAEGPGGIHEVNVLEGTCAGPTGDGPQKIQAEFLQVPKNLP